jgi:ribosomal protein S18 acetylase RimI-like enzyme
MVIREAKTEDLTELVEIFEAYRKFYRKEANSAVATKFLKERLSKNESIIYIAINAENKIIGFVQLYPSYSSTRLSKMWILNDLYVYPESRGQGISKLLIERTKLLAIQTNACGLLLETESDNIIANKLYLSTDFKLENNNFYFWTSDK